MDEAEQARAYAEADFSEANERFLELFDLLHPGARIDAVDGAPAMLALAGQALEQTGLEARIRLHCHHLPATALPRGAYDAVLSNSLLHHLKDPGDLWRTLRHCAAPGAAVLVMDLLRPPSTAALDALVREYAADAPEVLRRDFRASLHAAYTTEEVQAQLEQAGLDRLKVEQVSDRHLAVTEFLP